MKGIVSPEQAMACRPGAAVRGRADEFAAHEVRPRGLSVTGERSPPAEFVVKPLQPHAVREAFRSGCGDFSRWGRSPPAVAQAPARPRAAASSHTSAHISAQVRMVRTWMSTVSSVSRA